MLDQLGIGFRLGKAAVVVGAQGRRGGARGEQRDRFRATQRAERVGHLAGQQRPHAMAEQRIRRLERGFLFLGQLQRQTAHVGVQGLTVARAPPRKFHRLQLEPLRQFSPPTAIDHGTRARIGQAQQCQRGHRDFLEGCLLGERMRCSRN
ncbi:hypothetical protein D3C71_1561400 [compost metagenome]